MIADLQPEDLDTDTVRFQLKSKQKHFDALPALASPTPAPTEKSEVLPDVSKTRRASKNQVDGKPRTEMSTLICWGVTIKGSVI